MSTDVNAFDQYLKNCLYRDLLFRTIVWLGVSLATGFLVITFGGSTALSYFERVGKTLAPLVNSIGVGGLLLCLLALFLKDLEFVSKNAKTIAATRGMLGGFVRRLAGDISLWTLGALVAMLSAMIIALLHTSMSKLEVGAVSSLAFLLVLMAALTSIANVFVRRSGPTPWANEFKNSAWLVVVYTVAFAFLVGRLVMPAI
jgi:DMSO/TMAO reductase YedYZ heme-binding membrane subunit